MTDAAAHRELGRVLAAGPRVGEAEAAYRRALAAGERLAGQFPDIPNYRELLANCHLELSQLLVRAGRPVEAARLLLGESEIVRW